MSSHFFLVDTRRSWESYVSGIMSHMTVQGHSFILIELHMRCIIVLACIHAIRALHLTVWYKIKLQNFKKLNSVYFIHLFHRKVVIKLTVIYHNRHLSFWYFATCLFSNYIMLQCLFFMVHIVRDGQRHGTIYHCRGTVSIFQYSIKHCKKTCIFCFTM